MAQPIPNLIVRYEDANGLPLAGGKLYSYIAGTTTLQSTFTDATGGTPNTNPVILDANGEASVWIDQSGYKFVLTDSLDNVQWTKDGIFLIEDGSITTSKLEDGSVTPVKLDLSTLTSSDLPNNLIDTVNIKDNAVTTSKIPDGDITLSKLDPNLDFSQLGKTCEIVFSNNGVMGDGVIQGTPQYPWSAPALLSNPATIPPAQGGQPRWSRDGRFLAVPTSSSPFIIIYERIGSALTKLTDPVTLPAGASQDCSWSPDGQFLAVAHASAPYVSVYRRSGTTFDFIESPSPLSTNATGISWSPDGRYLAVANASGLTVFPFNKGRFTNGNGNAVYLCTISAQTGFINPGQVFLGGSDRFAILSPPSASQVLVQLMGGSPPSGTVSFAGAGGDTGTITVTATQLVSTGSEYYYFGTGVNIAPPGTTCNMPRWSPDSAYIAVAITASPYFEVYSWNGSALSAVTSPATLPSAVTVSTAWSPDGQLLAIGGTSGNYIYLYQWNGSTLTALSAPVTLPTGTVAGISWSPNGRLLALAVRASPYVMIYSFDGTTLTKLTDPASLPTGNCNGVSWSPSNRFLTLAGAITPYVFTYQTTGSIPSNSLLYVREVFDV